MSGDRTGRGSAAGAAAPSRPASRRVRQSPMLRLVEEFLRELKPDAPEPIAQYVREIMVSAIRLLDDQTPLADVKLLNAALRELRSAFRVFARYRGIRKVTTFGSARTAEGEPAYAQAERFARRIADEGFMIITGAGGGIMRACQAGAGRERSFGVNIKLPFEQRPNEFIANDPKLLGFKYFFTRKLLFVKEADALVAFPGGFGTYDEAFECLTLVQTGKSHPMPIVFVDVPGGNFWETWLRAHVHGLLLARGLISKEDLSLFRVTDDVETAVTEILQFYRVYHSSRYVGEKLVLRLTRHPSLELVEQLNRDFADLLTEGRITLRGPLPEENGDDTADLPRLVLQFNRASFGRLRQMIDFLNQMPL